LLHEWRSKGFWYLLDRGLGVFGLRLPAMAGTGVEVERLRQQRDEARAREDWAEADGLREAIRKWGFDVIDEPEGSRLVPK
jgi:cysteinyl-tRNA synthetase